MAVVHRMVAGAVLRANAVKIARDMNVIVNSAASRRSSKGVPSGGHSR